MKANLIILNLTALSPYKKVLFNRAIYGYIDNSNNGYYQYKRSGILAQMPHLRLLKGALVIKKKDSGKIIPIIKKHQVKYKIYSILIRDSELKKV